MEVVHTIQANCRVTATLEEDGTVAVKVFASAPYNAKGGTATADVTPPESSRKELASVMGKILREASEVLGEKLRVAIHTASQASARVGE